MDGGEEPTPKTATQPGSRPAEGEAPLAQPGARKLPVAVAVVLAVLIGGGSLGAHPRWGAFGYKILLDRLSRSEHEAALGRFRTSAQALLQTDVAADARRALRLAEAEQATMERFGPMGAYRAYLALAYCVRFGPSTENAAQGKRLLARARRRDPGQMGVLASAAQDAADGQLARARQAVEDLLKRHPDDVDAAVLAGEIELRAKEGHKALGRWRAAVQIQRSARTLFGLARAQKAVGQGDEARRSARAVLGLSPEHAGARTLIASLLWHAKDANEQAALGELEQVTDPEGAVHGAASASELVGAYTLLGHIELGRSRVSAAEAAYEVALKLDPKAQPALVGAGELLYRAGQVTAAADRFEMALRLDATSTEAKIGLAKTWLALDRAADALDLMKKALSAGAADPRLGYWQGRASAALGQPQAAEAAFRKAIELARPDDRAAEAYVALAELLRSQGRPSDAEQVLEQADERLPQSPRLFRAKGEAALAAGRLEEAKGELGAALGLDARDLASKLRLGTAHRRAGELAAAEQRFDEVAEIDPDYPGLAVERGLLLEQTGQIERALQMYREALRRAPNDLDLKLRLGATRVESGYAELAIAMLREIYLARPQSARAGYVLGRALLVQGSLTEALDLLSKAAALDPHRAEYFLYWGWAAGEAGRTDAAQRALDRALELDRSSGDVYWQRAVLLQKQGATRDALKELEIALALRPSRYEAYATMALCRQAELDWAAAEQAWRNALAGKDEVADWHYHLGRILFEQGAKRAEATRQLERAIELAKGTTPRWLYRAHRLAGLGLGRSDREKAIFHLRRYLDLAPNNDAHRKEVERALQRLEAK